MEILLPDNIFARILSSVLDDEDRIKLRYYPSSLLSKNAIEKKNAVALIPTLDLLNHKNLYISSKLGISFDEPISNSFIYFSQAEKSLKEIVLAGDVSTNEAILGKILFSENYGIDVQLSIEKQNGGSSHKNRILVGDRNFVEGNITSAVGFAEEVSELVSAPYVNFVFASESEAEIKEFHSKYLEIFPVLNPTEVFENMNENFHLSAKNYLLENLQHVLYDFDEQDLEGMKQLLQLPYYHGIIKDLIDVKLV
jgi:hypothetical protein